MTVFAHPTDLNACFVGTGLIARQRRVAGVSFPSFPSTLSFMGTRKSHDGGTTTPFVPVVPTNMREGTYVGAGALAQVRTRRRLNGLCISQNRGNDGNESVFPDAVLRISRSHESTQRWERTGTRGVEWERDRASPESRLFTPTVSLSPRSKETLRTDETNDARTAHELVRCIKGEDPYKHLLLWWPTPSSCCSSDSGVGAADAPVARGASTTMQTTTEHDTTTTDEPTAITAATGGGGAP